MIRPVNDTTLIETKAAFLNRLGTFSIGPIVGAAIGFVTVPITTRLVQPEVYGQLSMFTTATSLVSMLILLGVDQAYVRDYSASTDRRTLWYSALVLPLFLSLLVAAVVLAFAPVVGNLLFGTPAMAPMAGLAIAIPLLVLHRFVLLAVRMAEDGKLYSALHIGSRVLVAVMTITFVALWGSGLSQVLFPVVIAHAVMIVVAMLSSHVPGVLGARIDTSAFRRQLAFGLPLVASSALLWILNSLDKVALRTWSTFSEMGIYSAAFRLAALLLVVQQAFTTFWAPTSYRWYESGAPTKRFQTVTDIAALAMAGLYAVLIASRWLVVWLLGPEYRDAVHLLPLAAVYPIMVITSETTVMGIGFSRRTHWATIVTGVAAITNIFGNWILVPLYGAFGAALSTAVSFAVYFWMRTLISNRLWEGVKTRLHLVSHILIAILATVSIGVSKWPTDLVAGGFALTAIVAAYLMIVRGSRDQE
jgi:O-antigen/teichoic acid export membrane protein